MQIKLATLMLFALALSACTGEFDQRQEQAKTQGAGVGSTGTVANPNTSVFIRGTVSSGGAVKGAFIKLRRINPDASVDWNDKNALGTGVTFENGIFQVYIEDEGYRGPILIEVRGGAGVLGANPASSLSQKFHDMRSDHVLYSAVMFFEGYSIFNSDVTPLTSVAVARCLSLDGSIAGVTGGLSTGLFGLMCQQVAEFFGIGHIRGKVPKDYSSSGSFGNQDLYGRVLAALSQVARDIGVANVFDFHLGLYQDALDDGELNGSIGVVPNTPVAMPDLGAAGLIGSALFNNYMDPDNLERAAGGDNTQVNPGSDVDDLINTLDAARDIDDAVRSYELTVRVPKNLKLKRSAVKQTRILALDPIGGGVEFDAYGDSAGPSFVEFAWTSSSPTDVSVQPFGRITVSATAPRTTYTLTLTIQPLAGQTFVTGPVQTHTVIVEVD
jgi:hypothetical protein